MLLSSDLRIMTYKESRSLSLCSYSFHQNKWSEKLYQLFSLNKLSSGCLPATSCCLCGILCKWKLCSPGIFINPLWFFKRFFSTSIYPNLGRKTIVFIVILNKKTVLNLLTPKKVITIALNKWNSSTPPICICSFNCS